MTLLNYRLLVTACATICFGCIGSEKNATSHSSASASRHKQVRVKSTGELRDAVAKIHSGMSVEEARQILVDAGCEIHSLDEAQQDGSRMLMASSKWQSGLWVTWVQSVDVVHDGKTVIDVTSEGYGIGP